MPQICQRLRYAMFGLYNSHQLPSFLLFLVVHSQSVPNSPSIQRAAESSPSASNFQQKLANGHCSTAPITTTNGTSNFTFDNVVIAPPPTQISPTDLNSGKLYLFYMHTQTCNRYIILVQELAKKPEMKEKEPRHLAGFIKVNCTV